MTGIISLCRLLFHVRISPGTMDPSWIMKHGLRCWSILKFPERQKGMNAEWKSKLHISGLGAPSDLKFHEMLSVRSIDRALNLTFGRFVSKKGSISIIGELSIFDLFEMSVSKWKPSQIYIWTINVLQTRSGFSRQVHSSEHRLWSYRVPFLIWERKYRLELVSGITMMASELFVSYPWLSVPGM